MTLREKLLKDASAFCAEREISLARLGKLVVNDGKFFARISDGGDCTTGVYERFQKFFANSRSSDQAA